jgi:hypothetical protein
MQAYEHKDILNGGGGGSETYPSVDSTELVDFRSATNSKNDTISKSAVQTLYKNLIVATKANEPTYHVQFVPQRRRQGL